MVVKFMFVAVQFPWKISFSELPIYFAPWWLLLSWRAWRTLLLR